MTEPCSPAPLDSPSDFPPEAPVRELSSVGVVGAGSRGTELARLAASGGYRVFFTDSDPQALNRGVVALRQHLDRAVNGSRMVRAVRDAILDRLEPVQDLEALREVDLILEALPEVREAKIRLFSELDALCSAPTLLATTTSSLPVAELALASGRPDRFLGVHFPEPSTHVKMVEVVRTEHTAEATFRACWKALERMQKRPVLVRDVPGLLFNRLLMPCLNEVAWNLFEQELDLEAMDRALSEGGLLHEGPFALMDRIGLDVVLETCRALFNRTSDPRFRPSPLLVRMVEAGFLGRKSRRGFYDYGDEEPVPASLADMQAQKP